MAIAVATPAVMTDGSAVVVGVRVESSAARGEGSGSVRCRGLVATC